MPTAAMNDASVPILGQALTVEGYTIVVAARCQCQANGTLVPLVVTVSGSGTIAPANVCAKCGLGYGVQGLQMDTQGRLTFAVQILSQRGDA